MTTKELALKILQIGKAGFDTQKDGYSKLDDCIQLIEIHISNNPNLTSSGGDLISLDKANQAAFKYATEKNHPDFFLVKQCFKDGVSWGFTNINN